jgi:hypothetical protein
VKALLGRIKEKDGRLHGELFSILVLVSAMVYRAAVLDLFGTLTPAFLTPFFRKALLTMPHTLSLPDMGFQRICPPET